MSNEDAAPFLFGTRKDGNMTTNAGNGRLLHKVQG